MKVPAREQAFIESRKLAEYLLSETHPVGGSKARFFTGLGYEPPEDERLRNGLLSVLESDVVETKSTKYGTKYQVRSARAAQRTERLNGLGRYCLVY